MQTPLRKIAIFDDDEDILSICSIILEEVGWNVTTFTNCNDILDKVKETDPDVIIMDNWIPDAGGIQATQLLKNSLELKHIPVIYFSANSEIKSLMKQAGAQGYLAKPFDIEELKEVINLVLPI